MTKKDYELIASVFSENLAFLVTFYPKKLGSINAIRVLASNLATKLEVDNPRFDRVRFLNACGIASK